MSQDPLLNAAAWRPRKANVGTSALRNRAALDTSPSVCAIVCHGCMCFPYDAIFKTMSTTQRTGSRSVPARRTLEQLWTNFGTVLEQAWNSPWTIREQPAGSNEPGPFVKRSRGAPASRTWAPAPSGTELPWTLLQAFVDRLEWVSVLSLRRVRKSNPSACS